MLYTVNKNVITYKFDLKNCKAFIKLATFFYIQMIFTFILEVFSNFPAKYTILALVIILYGVLLSLVSTVI